MCIRDRYCLDLAGAAGAAEGFKACQANLHGGFTSWLEVVAVSYTHLRAHETVLDLVCRLLLEKKKKKNKPNIHIDKH